MRKTVYLHIGLEKTGSTSIQQVLYNNYSLLKDNGFLYPADLIGYPNHVELTTSYCKPNHIVKLRYDKQGAFRSRLKAYVGQNKNYNIVFSNEHLSSRMVSDGEKMDLISDLSSAGHEVIGVCYLRNPKSWLVSAYSEAVKSGYRGSIEEYIELKRNVQPFDPYCRRLASVIQGWKNVLKDHNLKVYCFEAAVREGLIYHFCKAISLPGIYRDLQDSAKVANPSMSPGKLKVVRQFNRFTPDNIVFDILRKALIKSLISLSNSKNPTSHVKSSSRLEDYSSEQVAQLKTMGYSFWK